ATIAESIPGTGFRLPSRPSSPRNRVCAVFSAKDSVPQVAYPSAANCSSCAFIPANRIATARGRSKCAPDFGSEAGDKDTTILVFGHANCELMMAVLIRWRDSLIAVSVRPPREYREALRRYSPQYQRCAR